jgi:hypothetical protein
VTADELEQDAATITRSSFWHLPEQRSCRTSGAGRDAQVRRLVGVIEETRRREGTRLTRGRSPVETCDGPVINDLGHSSGDTLFSQAA